MMQPNDRQLVRRCLHNWTIGNATLILIASKIFRLEKPLPWGLTSPHSLGRFRVKGKVKSVFFRAFNVFL